MFDVFVKKYGALANPAVYGPLIAGFTAVCYLGSIPFWYGAGKHYVAAMRAKKDSGDEEALLAKA